MKKALKTGGLWILQALMALMMVGPGVQKLTGSTWQRMFRVWGYPEHFYFVIGVIEVAAGLGLLVPRIATPSALLLMCVMAGAAITRLVNNSNPVGDLVFFTLLGVIAYARRSFWVRSGAPVAQPARVP
jgi:putative oxidoreductase